MSFRRSWPAFLFASILSVTLLRCDSDGGTVPSEDDSVGIFLDAAVYGLTYQSGDRLPQKTDIVGSFQYFQDEPITFSIGDIELGTLNRGSTVITPFDFPVPENIARFIQSFDSDLDPSNGIDLQNAPIPPGVSVSSSVFENPDRASFETDPAIVNALQMSSRTLVDATIAMNNLRDGTDDSFGVAELADQVFAFSLGFLHNEGAGFILFDALESSGASGSTGEYVIDEDGSSADGEDFTWDVSTSGVLTLNPVDSGDPSLVITKAGGTDRVLSATLAEKDEQPEPVALFHPLPVTETDVSGAPITQNGIASQTIEFRSVYGVVFDVTFKADGTFSSVQPDGVVDGNWSVNDLADDVIVMVPAQAQNNWRLIMSLDGELAGSGQAFVADATLTGGSIDNPELSFVEFSYQNSRRTR